jgi:hypothetical protein
MSNRLQIDDILNLQDYPVNDRKAAARASLVAQYKSQLTQNLYCAIPNFVKPEALAIMAQEASLKRPLAYDNNSRRNVYLQRQSDANLPDNHPRNLFDNSSTRMIAYDQIPKGSPLKTFYHSSSVRDFVGDIVGIEAIFDNEDPYQPANYV